MGESTVMAVVKVLTTIVSICVALSPSPDYFRMYRLNSTGDVSILPVVALYGNCFMWTVYGYLVGNIFPLFSVCLFGCVIAIAYSVVYYLLCPDRRHVRKLWTFATTFSVVIAAYAAIGVAGVTNQPRDQVEKILGFIATAVNLCLFASPLATMRHVVAENDSSSMPITMSVVALLSGTLWVVVGVDDRDLFVIASNGVGAVLSAVQIALYCVYRRDKPVGEEKATTETVVQDGASYAKALSTP